MRATDDVPLALTEALVALSAADLAFSDLYLHRADGLFGSCLSREQYRALQQERDGMPGMAKELRQLAEHGDWPHVRALAHEGAARARHLGAAERLLALGDALYGPRVLRADATALALSGTVVQPTTHLGRLRDDCVARLRFALAHDEAGAALYRMRLEHLAHLEIVADPDGDQASSPDGLRRRIIDAAERGDFEEADRLSTVVLDNAARNAPGRLHAPLDGGDQPRGDPFAAATIERARALGLSAVTLAADAMLNGYVAASATAALVPGYERPDATAVPAGLRDSLDLLVGSPFLTSAGNRYVPSFATERMLVETFPETEADAQTGLLDAIGLSARRGVSRLAIEDAVRRHGIAVCHTLGIDPLRYALVAIPFDAYVRLAPGFDWGRQPLWTHFDGYQLVGALRLRAVVGGNARYGGRHDVCSVGREYTIDHLVARFAVVDRSRLIAQALG